MIVVNFKNYKKGREVVDLAEKVGRYKKGAIVAVPTSNISSVVGFGVKVYAQHVDFEREGKTTGYNTPENLKSSGAFGSLLNHSEHRIKFSDIAKTIKRCNKAGLKLVIFAASLQEARKLKRLKPYAIAFEDPKLVGTGKSIIKYRSNDIAKFVKMLKRCKIIPLCGAGISSADDLKEAKKLGCKGVVVSSAVAKSNYPEKFLKNA